MFDSEAKHTGSMKSSLIEVLMTKRRFLKNLIIVLVLLLLFGAIAGFVVKFRNQDSEKVSTFSVRVNDTLT